MTDELQLFSPLVQLEQNFCCLYPSVSLWFPFPIRRELCTRMPSANLFLRKRFVSVWLLPYVTSAAKILTGVWTSSFLYRYEFYGSSFISLCMACMSYITNFVNNRHALRAQILFCALLVFKALDIYVKLMLLVNSLKRTIFLRFFVGFYPFQ